MFENITWKRHICGATRPDAQISVLTRKCFRSGVEIQTNVRYCNDNPNCLDEAKSFDFFGKGKEDKI